MTGIETAAMMSAAAADVAIAGTAGSAALAGSAAAAPTVFTLGNALLAASTLIGAVGALQQGAAAKAAGEAQARAAEYQAKLRNSQAAAMEQRAGQERAAAQRDMIEQNRQGRLIGSRAQTIAAASGAGALDPSIVDIMSDIDTEREFRAGTAFYQGEERARGLEYGAVLQRAAGAGDMYAGEVARRAGQSAADRSYLSAAGTLAMGAGKIASGSGRPAPKSTVLSQGTGLERYMEDMPFASYGGTRYGFFG